MGVKQTVVNRIQQLCDERGITVNTLATSAALTPSTLYSLLAPERKDIGIVTIKKICDGLSRAGVQFTLAEFFDTPEFNNLEQEIS